jgi:SAM-dependent methyltransferase
MSQAAFQYYSKYYDLIYADKDYANETKYILAVLARYGLRAGRLLEFGCGTGRHALLLAETGFNIIGIERSPDMAEEAIRRSASLSSGSFACRIGDIRSTGLGETFDAVLSLFHVISYQTTDDDVRAVFSAAAAHLMPGGLFFFDVWHGPAVLAQRPSVRTKRMEEGQISILRIAEPELDMERRLVTVNLSVLAEDRSSSKLQKIKEVHPMRYFFPPEIARFASESGFEVTCSEEFLTGAVPSELTWSVAYLLRRR